MNTKRKLRFRMLVGATILVCVAHASQNSTCEESIVQVSSRPSPSEHFPYFASAKKDIAGAKMSGFADQVPFSEEPQPMEFRWTPDGQLSAGGCGGAGCMCCPFGSCQDAPTNECPANPARSFPAIGHRPLLQMFAVDIARRSLLAVRPNAGFFPIQTEEVIVRYQGHYVRTYARLTWYKYDRCFRKKDRKLARYWAETSASLIYHPERRRVTDLSYMDNEFSTFRNVDRASQVVATYNEDFCMRDDVGTPARVLSQDLEILRPVKRHSVWRHLPFRAPDPLEKSLRTVRTDGNVTANQ